MPCTSIGTGLDIFYRFANLRASFMRLFIVLFFILSFFGVSLAQTTNEVSVIKPVTSETTAIINNKIPLETQITQLRQKIDQLERSVQGIKISKEKIRVHKLIAKYRWDLRSLEELQIPVLSIEAFVTVESEKITESVGQKLSVKKRRFQIAAAGGIFSGTFGFNAGIIVPQRLPKIGPTSSAFRVMGGFAQSMGGERRYLPLQIDGILNFPAGWITGEDNYVGAGINYTLITTGRTAGTFGGEIFYGVVSEGFEGYLFGELGYGTLRTGFSPQQEGVSLLVGYQKDLFY